MKEIVAIVGKPNVGKSTLFNRLIGKRKSIVHDEAGVTRDRLYHDVSWQNFKFKIIDTGGIEVSDKPFQEQIIIQAKIAIEEASTIVFIVDGREEISNADYMVMELLRRSDKRIIIAANKLEANKELDYSIYNLGADQVFSISALHGEGVGDLLDEVTREMKPYEDDGEKNTKLSIIGRPNAGKSSLLNKLLNEERAIVSEISGTTRDSVQSTFMIGDEEFDIIDTAGINKKSKLIESVDHFALSSAINSLEEADLTILVIDATREKLAHFDARVAGYAMENNKPIIIVINKWDLIKKETMTMKSFEDKIRKEFKFMTWAPIVFISALTGSRLDKLLETVQLVKENMTKKIKTSLINELTIDMQMMHPAPSFKGGNLKIAYARQDSRGRIPTFVLFVNNTDFLHFSYERFIANQIREYFGFEGTPLRLIFKNKRGFENA